MLSLFARFVVALVAVWVSLGASPGYSHEIRPSIVSLHRIGNGQLELVVTTNLEAVMAGIGPQHKNTDDSPNAQKYNELRKLEPTALEAMFEAEGKQFSNKLKLSVDGKAIPFDFINVSTSAQEDLALPRDSFVFLRGPFPARANEATFSWDSILGPVAFRIESKDKDGEDAIVATFVKGGETSKPLPLDALKGRNTVETMLEYVVIGFDHIIPKGLDHILFVVGLYLLSTKLGPLLWQVTSFTVAHTVTLGLGMAGIIALPGYIVEPLIAASIVYVAVENIFMDHLSPWRTLLVFMFGLLHGMGFAGVLNEVGLPTLDFVAGLISFNVGVELGQLTIIVACFLLFGHWFGSKPWYRKTIVIPLSLGISAIASWWFFERVFLV